MVLESLNHSLNNKNFMNLGRVSAKIRKEELMSKDGRPEIHIRDSITVDGKKEPTIELIN